MQSKLAQLQQYCDRIGSSDATSTAAACAITVADVIDGIACVMPKDKRTAEKFCLFLYLIASYAGPLGCDVILQAGGIPVLFDCLRSWPRERNVVNYASWALFWLVEYGSLAVKSAMRSVPDCEALLIAAYKSKSACYFAAAAALEELGYEKPGCAIM